MNNYNKNVSSATLHEAKVLTRYLLGNFPDTRDVELYTRASETLHTPMNKRTEDLWNIAMKHPWVLPYFDSGIRHLESGSAFRQKILIMLAVLETNPRHADFFLYRRDSLWFLKMAWFGFGGLLRTTIGRYLIQIL